MASCIPMEQKGKLTFRDLRQEEIDEMERRQEAIRQAEVARLELQREKKREMEEIISDAKAGFEEIKPLLKSKCFDCHDSNTKLPAYGRIFPRINPIHKHQVEGIKALDFVDGYPLKAQGTPLQISLLKSIRNEVLDRGMPLKSYTLVYRSKRIFEEDERRILNWVDPLITRLLDFSAKYESMESNPRSDALKILEMKCYRCHAHGVAKGGFGDMEDTKKLLSSEYVDLNNPDQSEIYKLSENKEMPTNKRDALSDHELFTLREWLILESKEKPKN
jgi:hypothetical protein